MKTPDAMRKLNISSSDSQSRVPMILEKREVLIWRPETPAETASRIRIAEADAEFERTKSLIILVAMLSGMWLLLLISVGVFIVSSSPTKETSVALILAAFLSSAAPLLLATRLSRNR